MHGIERLRGVVVCRDRIDELAVKSVEAAEKSVAQRHGAFDDRIEHRLYIRGRLADDAQNFAGRGLLVERLAHLRMRLRQRLVLLLQLRKEPHVLDGDDRLVREGLEEGDLGVGERPYLHSAYEKSADRFAFAKQWCPERRPV